MRSASPTLPYKLNSMNSLLVLLSQHGHFANVAAANLASTTICAIKRLVAVLRKKLAPTNYPYISSSFANANQPRMIYTSPA